MEDSEKQLENPGTFLECSCPVDCEKAARTQPGTSPPPCPSFTGLEKEGNSRFLGYITEHKGMATAHFSPISAKSVPLCDTQEGRNVRKVATTHYLLC